MEINLPPTSGPNREAAILQAVKDGKTTFKFAALDVKVGDNEATFFVFSDALKLDGIRVNVCAATQQQIADTLGCVLPTAKIADHIFLNAEIIVPPKFRPITSSTQAMIDHSKDIDKVVGNKSGLISTVGKHWIIDDVLYNKNIGTACNYGWHFKGGLPGIKGDLPVSYKDLPGVRLIQSRGTFHDFKHSDYSQTCTLVARECEVNGKSMDILEVLKDPKLAYLASHSGPLKILRQPGVKDPKINFIIP
jgi:hypothetical protein